MRFFYFRNPNKCFIQLKSEICVTCGYFVVMRFGFYPCKLSTLLSHFLQRTYLFSQVLSLQHSGSKDSPQSKFASYWKPILSMDANFWQRWLHMHRITIILEHDM